VLGQVRSVNKKAQQYFEAGSKNLQLHNYDQTIADLKNSISHDPSFASAFQQLGDVYRLQHKYAEAIPYYQKVMELAPSLTTLTLFGLGESLLFTGQYMAAIPYLEEYGQGRIGEKGKLTVAKYLADCKYAVAHSQPEVLTLVKLSDAINTADDEYFPKLTADNANIIFTRKENQQENFYESHLMDGEMWSDARKLVGAINSDHFNEGAHCISPDGKYLFFTGCNRPNGLGSCDIYISKKENGKWTEPMNLGEPVNTRGWEAQPAISADGRTLYFVSNRAGGIGGNDIWKSQLGKDGKWGIPVNLGKNINTVFDESAPYIHADSHTLYFASNGWPGFGGQDIYMSQMDSTGAWEKPRNLGKPINNHYNQTSMHVNMSGAIGFFSSQDSTGQLDIYSFQLPDGIKPSPVAYIKGIVLDSERKMPLLANISVTNTENNEVVFEDISDYLDGQFIATLPIGNNYAVHVQSEGYLFDSEQYDLVDIELANEEFIKEILLDPIKSGSITRLDNVYFDINKYDLLPDSESDLQLLLNFLKLNSSTIVEIGGHTDSTGNQESNKTLSEKRAQAVVSYLMTHGIAAQQISSKGYGDQWPVADNGTEEGRRLNRRTEIKVLR
jgi:outer membrane protein OmpA-like peptidoglycan-associated protein